MIFIKVQKAFLLYVVFVTILCSHLKKFTRILFFPVQRVWGNFADRIFIVVMWLVWVSLFYTPLLRSCQLTTQYSNSETLVLLAQLKGHINKKPRLARIATQRLKYSAVGDITPRKLMFTVLVSLDDDLTLTSLLFFSLFCWPVCYFTKTRESEIR